MKRLPYPIIPIKDLDLIDLESSKLIDDLAVKKYAVPVELMMENAGLHIAHLAALFLKNDEKITIGVGKGNNGGSGLVAARKLLSWGFKVQINIPDKNLKSHVLEQLKRALTLGAVMVNNSKCSVFIDAFFGYSQRLPLPQKIVEIIEKENRTESIKIAVDLPTGYSENTDSQCFQANIICALSAPKKILLNYTGSSKIVVADTGIPIVLYKENNIKFNIPFSKSAIFELDL
jgi:NAD(P)H-hydrate epimerase